MRSAGRWRCGVWSVDQEGKIRTLRGGVVQVVPTAMAGSVSRVCYRCRPGTEAGRCPTSPHRHAGYAEHPLPQAVDVFPLQVHLWTPGRQAQQRYAAPVGHGALMSSSQKSPKIACTVPPSRALYHSYIWQDEMCLQLPAASSAAASVIMANGGAQPTTAHRGIAATCPATRPPLTPPMPASGLNFRAAVVPLPSSP